jgi:hypothetical protein
MIICGFQSKYYNHSGADFRTLDLLGKHMICGRNHQVRVVMTLFCLSFAIRIVFLLQFNQSGEDPITSNAEMALGAASIARGDGLGNLYGDYTEATGPSAHASPLYALWLAGIYRLFGYNTPAALLTQSLLSIFVVSTTAALIPVLSARARLTPGAGLLAGFASAVLPCNLWLEVDGAWEQPYAALALLVLLWLFFTIHDDNWQRWKLTVLTGLWVGLIGLLNPSLLPAVVLLVLAEFHSRAGIRYRVLLHTSVMLLCCMVVMSPWVYRNYAVFGQFIPFRSNLGLELLIGNNPDATGRTGSTVRAEDAHLLEMHPHCNKQERDHLKAVGEIEYMREKKEIATEWIRDHPSEFMRLTIVRFTTFWFPSPDMWGLEGRARHFNGVVFPAVAALAFAALVMLIVIRHDYRWIFLGAVFGPTLIYMITHVDSRYRYTVFALTTLLACDLIVRLVRRIRFGQHIT